MYRKRKIRFDLIKKWSEVYYGEYRAISDSSLNRAILKAAVQNNCDLIETKEYAEWYDRVIIVKAHKKDFVKFTQCLIEDLIDYIYNISIVGGK